MTTDRRSIVLVGIVLFGLAVMVGAVAAQQQPAAGAAAPAAGRGNFGANFTGKIEVRDSADMRMSRIYFEAGSRTNWHLHSTPQLLLVEDGRGRLQEQGSAIVEIAKGQSVLTKANVLHWHGAAPDQAALQFSVYSGSLEWKEPVTDEQYLGKKR
jgi:quercetin dioxygenase-like cupin family protein